MSTAIDIHNRLHAAQLSFADKAQDLTLVAVRRVTELREKAPKVPTPKAPEAVTRLAEPLTTNLAKHRQDWEENAKSFRERLSVAVKGVDAQDTPATVTVVRTSPAKKTAKKKA